MSDITRPADGGDHLYVGPVDDPNKYRLGQTVGAGAEGEVIRSEVLSQGAWRTVAVKVLHRGDAGGGDTEFERRTAEWQEQLNLVQFLAHQGVVRMRELFAGAPPHYEDDPRRAGRSLYLVMNWAPGETLSTWIVSNPQASYGARSRVLVQIGAALGYLHSGKDTGGQSVLHGDLKPGNVIVADDGAAQIVDFGLARGEGFQARKGLSGGFAAPELRDGAATSKASDIYALGAIAYTLFVGASPPEFSTTTYDPGFLRAQLERSSIIGNHPELVDHVLAAMAVNPLSRPAEAGDWVKALSTKTSVVDPNEPEPLPGPAPGSVVGGNQGWPVAAGGYGDPSWPVASPAPAPAPAPAPTPAKRKLGALVAALVLLIAAAGGIWYAVAGNAGDGDAVAASGSPGGETTSSSTSTSTSTTTTQPPTTTTTRPPTTTTTRPPTTTTRPPTTTTTSVPATTVPSLPLTLAALEPVDGRVKNDPVFMDGVEYTDVVRSNLHPFSIYTIEYNLEAAYSRFSGTVGFSDDMYTWRKQWELRISSIENGEERILSQVYLGDGQNAPFDVDVTGVRRFTLSVRLADKAPLSAGPSTNYPVVWANPALAPA